MVLLCITELLFFRPMWMLGLTLLLGRNTFGVTFALGRRLRGFLPPALVILALHIILVWQPACDHPGPPFFILVESCGEPQLVEVFRHSLFCRSDGRKTRGAHSLTKLGISYLSLSCSHRTTLYTLLQLFLRCPIVLQLKEGAEEDSLWAEDPSLQGPVLPVVADAVVKLKRTGTVMEVEAGALVTRTYLDVYAFADWVLTCILFSLTIVLRLLLSFDRGFE